MTEQDAEKDGAWEWGYKHSQGTNWVGSEAGARFQMESSMNGDGRKQRQAQKRQRLVKRWVGNPIEVENPWAEVTEEYPK